MEAPSTTNLQLSSCLCDPRPFQGKGSGNPDSALGPFWACGFLAWLNPCSTAPSVSWLQRPPKCQCQDAAFWRLVGAVLGAVDRMQTLLYLHSLCPTLFFVSFPSLSLSLYLSILAEISVFEEGLYMSQCCYFRLPPFLGNCHQNKQHVKSSQCLGMERFPGQWIDLLNSALFLPHSTAHLRMGRMHQESPSLGISLILLGKDCLSPLVGSA